MVAEEIGVRLEVTEGGQVFVLFVVVPSPTHALGMVKVGRWQGDVSSGSAVPKNFCTVS